MRQPLRLPGSSPLAGLEASGVGRYQSFQPAMPAEAEAPAASGAVVLNVGCVDGVERAQPHIIWVITNPKQVEVIPTNTTLRL